MRSVWIQTTLLIIYLVLVFVISRILDLVLWYQHGISSTQIVDPLLLSVRQLKQLLENRGVSYTGYVEKKELAELVEASAIVVQSEVEELGHVHGGTEADKSARERLPAPPPPSHFTGGPHFYEEVEDTKDSVWLVQVVPTGGPHVEPLLDDYSWRIVCNQVAPFAIRTGVFDCRLDRRLCSSKGWHHPLLLLALPKGTRPKDRVMLKTFTSTRPQVTLRLWWKHVARCLWTAVSYNFWLFSVWLLILATYRFSLVSFLGEKGLIIARYVSLTEIGSLLRADWQILTQHPYILFFTFFVYGLMATWLLQQHCHNQAETERDSDHPWWEVLPMDSYWINCLFRPMVTLTRPLPPSELELEEGIEMLIERLAVPNLWLQPVIPNEYIKDLPVWKFRGWDTLSQKSDGKRINKTEDSPEVVERMMDGEDPYELLCQSCEVHRCGYTSERVKYRHLEFSPNSQKSSGNSSTQLHQRNVDQTHQNCCSCSKSFTNVSTEVCSASDRCQTYDRRNSQHRHANSDPENVQSRILCSLCTNRPTLTDRLSSDVTVSDSETSVSTKWDLGNKEDSLSYSEDSGDETNYPPVGMLPSTECAVCLESYEWGALLCGLPCGHNYHQCCIMVWLGRDNHHCPVCRWPAYKSKHSLSHLHRE
ncbi:hypothetical protein B7P43_G17696 [Cryptotermes secundus]|uniref:RING-type domain-containing protein n=1 Tax=Cryptotermes secundus TaxID=105785 RepID=A0A2J7Q088_9NEOP|nr:E3 ubiquitin-protein ligase RNF103 isoform X2 [Cryptotermes secundus]PNF21993.1 hypothetical protein B7P43_G17696 [Cryptotermes secundus]